MELLSERRSLDRFADYIDWRRNQLEWWIRSNVKSEKYPRPIVVLTTSRSGSTWLCEVASQALRVGRIPEHLRPRHLQLANRVSDAELMLVSLISKVKAHIASGRSGGTKIIWDDIPGIHALQSVDKLVSWLSPLNEINPLWIRLVRQDRGAQAVSRYRAAQTGIYHRFEGQSLFAKRQVGSSHAPKKNPPLQYDFEAIHRHYLQLTSAEEQLTGVIADLPWPVHTILYEEAVQPPYSALSQAIATAAGISRDLASARIDRIQQGMHLAMTRSDGSQRMAQQFNADLTERAR